MTPLIIAGDLFCGAGGTSSGMARAVGRMGARLQLAAVNHWPVAVATHAKNHPEAMHHCLDISTARPEDVVPGGYLDLLCASPECVFFSRARGGRPVNDQRRSGAWWLLEWLARLDVRRLLVENVEEFQDWGPVLPTGRPDPAGKGRYFEAWVQALWAMGYVVDWRVLNAADFGDATTRRRLFVQARKDGKPIRWPEPTHSKNGSDDLFGAVPKWRSAREIIDWRNLGDSMLEREARGKAPLSVKTRLRIGRGLQRFGGVLAPLYIRLLDLPEDDETKLVANCADGPVRAFVLSRNGHNDPNGRVRGADDPLATVTSSGSGTGYLTAPTAEAFMAVYQQNAAPKSTSEPLGTLLTEDHVSLITPIAESFVFGNRENNVPKGTNAPAPTFTTATGGGAYVVNPQAEPFVLGQQSDSAARDTSQPIPTVSTAGVVRLFSGTAQPFLDVYYQTGVADSIGDPLSTATTKPRHALVSPFAVPFYGERPGQTPRTVDLREPLDTVTTAGRFGLASPVVVQIDQSGTAGAGVKSADEPLGTMVTKANRAVATPIASVITPGFAERQGQAPRLHDIDEPVPAIAATGHLHLATATIEIPTELAGVDPRRLVLIDDTLHLLDIKFRMLTNRELAAAMGFPSDYQFTGTKSDVTKQIGNAVCVGVSAALVEAMLDGATGATRRSA